MNALVHGARGLGKHLLTALLELVEGDHPVGVALAVDDHNLLHVGQIGAVLDQFVDLGLILGDHDTASRVGDDKRDVAGIGLRLHGGSRGTSAHHGEVDKYPIRQRVEDASAARSSGAMPSEIEPGREERTRGHRPAAK